MYKVFQFSQSQLRVAEFAGLHINIDNQLQQADQEALGVNEEHALNYSQLVQSFKDLNKADIGSERTAVMKAADDRRDACFRRCQQKLVVGAKYALGDAKLMEMTDSCQLLLTRYKTDLTVKAYQEETSLLEGFVVDVNKLLTDEQQRYIGLVDEIAKLQEYNSVFITAYAERAGERAAGDTGKTAAMRQQINELFDLMMLNIQYRANDTSSANAASAKVCQDFLGVINEFLKDAKSHVLARLNRGGVADTNTEGEGAGEGTGTDAKPTDGEGTEGSGNKPSGEDSKPTGDSKPSGEDSKPSGGDKPAGGDTAGGDKPIYEDDERVEW